MESALDRLAVFAEAESKRQEAYQVMIAAQVYGTAARM
jgi:hypothetical protein